MNRLPNLFSPTRCLVLFLGLFALSTYESPGLIAQTDNTSIPANGFTEESKALTADCFENYATLHPSILKIEQLVRAGKN